MAKFVFKDAYVAINGTAISDHCSSCSVESEFDDVEFTSFGAIYKEYGQGLGDCNITLDVFQDYAAASIDAIFWPLSQSGGTFGVEVRPTSAVVGTANPKYTMTGRLFSFNPIQGDVGDAATTEVQIRNAGTLGLVRGTS